MTPSPWLIPVFVLASVVAGFTIAEFQDMSGKERRSFLTIVALIGVFILLTALMMRWIG